MKVANERESRRAWWIRVRVFLVSIIEFDEKEERKEEEERDGSGYGEVEFLHGW